MSNPADKHAQHIQAHADALSQAMGQVSGITTVQQGQAGTYTIPAGSTLIGNSAGSVITYNGTPPVTTANAVLQMVQEQANLVKKKQLAVFLACPPEQREAYLTYRRALEVATKMAEVGSVTGLNHLQSIFTITGYPGMGVKTELSLQALEDAHASDVLEQTVLTDDNK